MRNTLAWILSFLNMQLVKAAPELHMAHDVFRLELSLELVTLCSCSALVICLLDGFHLVLPRRLAHSSGS